MESEPVSETQTLENTYAFLRTDEWKVLVDILEYNIRDERKKNLQKAAPFWTAHRASEITVTTHTRVLGSNNGAIKKYNRSYAGFTRIHSQSKQLLHSK